MCYAAENRNLATSGKGILHWNLQWDIPLRWVNYFIFPGAGKLFNLPWDSTVLLQTGPVKMCYTWDGTCPIGKRENRSGLPYPFPGPSLPLLTAQPPGQHVWFVQPGQVPEAAHLLFSRPGVRDLSCTSAIMGLSFLFPHIQVLNNWPSKPEMIADKACPYRTLNVSNVKSCPPT